MDAEADDHLRGLGRGGAGPARLDRMGRGPRRGAQKKAVAYVNSDSNGRGFLYMSGSHTLEQFINQVAREVADPQNEGQRGRTAAGAPDRVRRRRRAPGAQGGRATGPTFASARWARAPTTRPSCSTSASRRSTSASAARTATASTIPSTTRSRTTRASTIRRSSTGSPWPSWPGGRCCGWRRPTCCPSSSPPSRTRWGATSGKSRSWPTTCARRPRKTTCWPGTRLSSSPPTPGRHSWRPGRRRRCRS